MKIKEPIREDQLLRLKGRSSSRARQLGVYRVVIGTVYLGSQPININHTYQTHSHNISHIIPF